MKVAIGLLTYNRKDLFLRTYSSLYDAAHDFTLHMVDNGSTDGTADIVAGLGGFCNRSENHSTGYGMNLAIGACLETDADLIVFTADDYQYRKGWLWKLVKFWNEAPADVAIATCHLEPHWAWNEISEADNAGGQRYVLRASIPGSNWIFHRKIAPLIMPIKEQTGGEDLQVCERLRTSGYKLAALDLAVHIGERQSAWGNESWRYAKPFDYERYGFERLP